MAPPRRAWSPHRQNDLTTGKSSLARSGPGCGGGRHRKAQGLPAQVVQANFREAARVLAEQHPGGQRRPARPRRFQPSWMTRHAASLTVPTRRRWICASRGPPPRTWSHPGPRELTRILRDCGEEPTAWQIAGKIVAARQEKPILTTMPLARWSPPLCPGRAPQRRTRPAAPSRPSASSSARTGRPERAWTPSLTAWLRVVGSASSPSTAWRTAWSRTSSAVGRSAAPARRNRPSAPAAGCGRRPSLSPANPSRLMPRN